MVVPLLMISHLFQSKARGCLQSRNDGALIAVEDLLFQGSWKGCMRCPGQGIGVPMESALAVTDGELEAGQNL